MKGESFPYTSKYNLEKYSSEYVVVGNFVIGKSDTYFLQSIADGMELCETEEEKKELMNIYESWKQERTIDEMTHKDNFYSMYNELENCKTDEERRVVLLKYREAMIKLTADLPPVELPILRHDELMNFGWKDNFNNEAP